MSREGRRALLLDAARDVVVAEGFTALTIDRVAKAADVTRTVVYQHFTDLAGLMNALLDRESAIAFAGIGTVEQDRADVDAVGRGILAYLHAAPDSWRIILRPAAGAPKELRERIEIGRAYARKVAAGHLSQPGSAVDPDGPTAHILLASIEELARLHLDNPAAHPDELVLRYLRSLVTWATRLEQPVSQSNPR